MSKKITVFNSIIIAVFFNVFIVQENHAEELSYLVVPIELRQQIKLSVLEKTNDGFQKIIESARNNESVPYELSFLIDIAIKFYKNNNLNVPSLMDSRAVLSAFASRSEAVEAMETYYRNEAFHVFNTNRPNNSVLSNLERSKLTFHIVDEEATIAFKNYYNANPTTTFNATGKLVNPSIPGVPSDVMILGVFSKDRYGLDEQLRNQDGSLCYVAVKNKIGLDGNNIRSAIADINENTARVEVTFALDDEGSRMFYQLTSANIGKTVAIVLDNQIKSTAIINSAIYNYVKMTGFDIEEALMLSRMLRTSVNQ
jgi:hypothetical protein